MPFVKFYESVLPINKIFGRVVYYQKTQFWYTKNIGNCVNWVILAPLF